MWALCAELNAELSVFVNANDGRILFDAASEHQRVQSANTVENEPICFLTCQNREHFIWSFILRFTFKQVTQARKLFLVFASTRMPLIHRIIDPVSLAIVVAMQPGLIIPS